MKRPAIVDVFGTPRAGPWCEQHVHVSTTQRTRTVRRREEVTTAKGIPVDQCGDPARFRFNGVLLCRAHASAEALSLCMGAD